MHSSTLSDLENHGYGDISLGISREESFLPSAAAELAMAVQEANNHDAKLTPRIPRALPLVDFEWKLKYAVASATIAAVDKPLLRLELYVSKAPSKVEEAGLGTVFPENQIQPCVAEFYKGQLDALLSVMDAVEQGLARAESSVEEAMQH